MIKNNRNSVWLWVFVSVSVLHLLGFIFENGIVRHLTKPLLLISLGLFYRSSVNKINWIYLIAVFFSFLGDVLLIFDSELNFILGLATFLISHIFYIVMVLKGLEQSSHVNKVRAAIPFIVLFFVLISFLKDSLDVMLIPVVVYGLVISLFGTMALLNFKLKKNKPSLILLIGAILFIISDSILAINKFYSAKEILAVSVMITYLLAQYCICVSVIQSDRK